MEKDNYLINIYLKIHNKHPLTMDDLRYLAEYDPECFEKTCKNVVYNLPESKPVMEPVKTRSEQIPPAAIQNTFDVTAILNNLKQLESKEQLFSNIDINHVKNLLGSLYMELLFPHNDKDTFISINGPLNPSTFDVKA